MKKSYPGEFVYQAAALLVAVIVVHAVYVAVVRPQADTILALQAAAMQADPDYVQERSVWVIIRDFEQEACFVLMLWAMANGYAPVLTWGANPVWFVALLLLTPVWISFHFYWIHRFLHWPPLYKVAHALHHRNTNVGPWSGLSMHPIEHLLFFSSVLIHWVLAAHPIHILFHMQHQALTAATSHTGYENLLVKDKKRLALGTFHHQMHHRYFECNYGNLEVPWDRWFGSFHDGTAEATETTRTRKKRMHA